MSLSNSLTNVRYFSLATFRKSGAMVATPVWFAEDAGVYYVFSAGNARPYGSPTNGSKPMPKYRRAFVPGGAFFLTLVTYNLNHCLKIS